MVIINDSAVSEKDGFSIALAMDTSRSWYNNSAFLLRAGLRNVIL